MGDEYGSECVVVCNSTTDCNGNGRCDSEGQCVCEDGFAGESCDSCHADGFGPTCQKSCSATETCNGSGRCLDDGTCDCFPKFNCGDVLNVLSPLVPGLTSGVVCPDADAQGVVQSCVGNCSAAALDECEMDFMECVLEHSLDTPYNEGACECVGRLRACTVDAGCEVMSDNSIIALCDTGALGCTASQCQLQYPAATHCDWDSHDTCKEELAQCLSEPPSTVLQNESWYVQQDKYAARCVCYRSQFEVFDYILDESCSMEMEVEQEVWYEWVNGTWTWNNISNGTWVQGNGSWVEMRGPVPWTKSYNFSACKSECKNEMQKKETNTSFAYDCAVCGDGDYMPGREECDDNNLVDLDGCSHQCEIEPPLPSDLILDLSRPDSSPGQIVVTWNHTDVAMRAFLEDLPHRVFHYVFKLDRTICVGCPTVSTEAILQWSDCSYAFCSVTVPSVVSGEFIDIEVFGVNVAGAGNSTTDSLRWMYLPFYDVQLNEREIGLQIELEWVAPSDTGYGDDTSLPILMYFLEVSSCPDFRQNTTRCEYYATEVLPPAGGNFSYPIRYNLTFPQHLGFYYYYSILPINELGRALNTTIEVFQYGVLAAPTPFVAYPAANSLPVPVAVTPELIET
eukprot:2746649-Rhodomonas_salina.1